MVRRACAHFLVDQLGKCAFVVGVAGQRGSNLSLLTQGTQRGALAEIAGFNDDPAFVGRSVNNGLDRGRNIAAADLYQDSAPAAKQRHRMRFFDEPRRIARQFVTLDACQRERVVGSSTDARTSASTRSRTRPMSGPKTSTMG